MCIRDRYNMAKNLRGQESTVAHSVKDKAGRLSVDPDEISDRWGEYFSELYNQEEGEENLPERREEQLRINVDEGAITMEELEMAMGNMKNGRVQDVMGCRWRQCDVRRSCDGC